MTDPSPSDPLDHLEQLPKDASLSAVEEWLEQVAEHAKRESPTRQALIREAVVSRLADVESIDAPAKLADVSIRNPNLGGTERASQGTSLNLEDPEPWPERVYGPPLLEELAEVFTTYLALPDGAAVVLTLWTLHAHAHDAFPLSPVLAITSPEKRCGKTTLLELLSVLVPRPLPASNLTPAVVFRAVERWRPTLLVDEGDTFLKRGSELRGVLNSGHQRSMAHVPRCVGDENEVRQFRTWAPKAVALIGQLPDTLADRSIEVRMRRRAPDEEVASLRRDQLEREAESIRRRAWRWAQEHMDALTTADPNVPGELNDREQHNWRPLLAIADRAGGPWPERARGAAERLSGDRQDDRSLGTQLLADVREILEEHSSDRIRSKKLVEKLCDLEEAPWAEYKGRGLSTVSLANFLRSFDVSSKQLRFKTGSYKGYERDAFEDAFRRYLPSSSENPPVKAKPPKQSDRNKGSDDSRRRNTGGSVSGRESAERPEGTRNVSGVSEREGDPREEGPEPDILDLPF